jgi:alkylation response protein AidB-like acyl-CoA dehydrogenase
VTSPSALVEAARRVGPVIAQHADAGEHRRRLPAATVEALVEADLMRMCVPSVYGGPEATPMELVEAIAAVAEVDGAAGWCTMIASTTSSMSMFLPPAWAHEIYGDPSVVTGGVYAPNGAAQPEGDAWAVSGRWAWGSGTQHCRWITGGARTSDGAFHLMFLDAADVTFHDTWHTVGMRGTGSVDFSVDHARVPFGRSVMPGVSRPTVEVPLAAFPNFSLLASGVAAVSLGIARRALDELRHLAEGKRPLFSSRTLAENAVVQAELARAEASLQAARALLLGELSDAWHTVLAGGSVDVACRTRIRLATVHAAEASAKATDTAYTWAGGSSVYDTSPLPRCWRDAHVATQHLMVSPRMYETLGRALLGLDVDTVTL